jgi:dynein assembly factor 1, axonemal
MPVRPSVRSQRQMTGRPVASVFLTHNAASRRYAQQNRIRETGSLACVPNLVTLDISNNEIFSLEGVEECQLETLLCTHNYLETADSIRHLEHCTSLQTLDLQSNQLADIAVLEIIRTIPNLKCLYLKGNPVVSQIKNYRSVRISLRT